VKISRLQLNQHIAAMSEESQGKVAGQDEKIGNKQ